MGKKLTQFFAAGVAIVSTGLVLGACSGKKQGTGSSQNMKNSIALITDSNGVNDQSFNQSAWEGFKQFGRTHNMKQGKGYQYFQSSSASDFTPNFNQAAKSGYQTIVGVGFMLTDSVKAAAKKNPKKNFVIIDDVIKGQKNVASVTFKSNESSYL
ncbi:BMP family ABC transporter substrate-binding protein, partial [Lactobacillus sp. XV13L]|nr:BMP family ABC transporter substrate-binding protein [Lactobacillus sp. XV13L]